MQLSDLCDLHCHYLPGVDDGVRTPDEGRALCVGLAQLGYTRLVATPHMRPGMFDNESSQLLAAYETFRSTQSDGSLPLAGLAAEHFCDDIFFERLARGAALPYPGGHAALVEFPADSIPVKVADRFFRMQVRGIRPVLAHPERYSALWKSPGPLRQLTEGGALALLDLMSLVGKYGRKPQHTAESFLDEALYYAASTDCHRPDDVELVGEAIERLVALVGADEAQCLLAEHPQNILAGTVQD